MPHCGRHPEKGTHVKVRGRFTSYRKVVPGGKTLSACLNPATADFEPSSQASRERARWWRRAATAETRRRGQSRRDQWGRRSSNASHSPARQRGCRPPAAHPLSDGETGQVDQGAGQGRRHARHARQGQGCRQRCDGLVGSQQHAGQYCAGCGCHAVTHRAGHCAARWREGHGTGLDRGSTT